MKEKLDHYLKTKKIRKDQCLILFLAGILLLVIVWPVKTSEKSNETDNIHDTVEQTPAASSSRQGADVPEYEAYWEEKLASILSGIPGAGTVKVMVYMSETGEQVTLKDIESGENRFTEETVYTTDEKGRKVPFVAKQKLPRVTGVLVAAQGAGQASVEQSIRCAVTALFGLENDKVMILAMER